MVNDPIADLITQIRNALAVRKEFVELPTSNVKEEVCKILKKNGFIEDFKRFKEKGKPYKSLHIDLKYSEEGNFPVVTGLRRLSKPGARFYSKWKELPVSKGGRGLFIVSTSKGLMSASEARKKKLGGEVWCEIH